jgi:hypothetical protein
LIKILIFENLILNFLILKKKKRKKEEEEQGWPIHPQGGGQPPPSPWGWLDHHQTGRSGGGRATPMA